MIGKDPVVFNLVFGSSFSSPQKAEVISPVKPVFEIIKKRGHKRVIHTGYQHIVKLI